MTKVNLCRFKENACQTFTVLSIVALCSYLGFLAVPAEYGLLGIFAGWAVGGYFWAMLYNRVDGYGFNYCSELREENARQPDW